MDNVTIMVSVMVTVVGIYELANSHYSKWKEGR